MAVIHTWIEHLHKKWRNQTKVIRNLYKCKRGLARLEDEAAKANEIGSKDFNFSRYDL